MSPRASHILSSKQAKLFCCAISRLRSSVRRTPGQQRCFSLVTRVVWQNLVIVFEKNHGARMIRGGGGLVHPSQ
jgi:hypothetical protein